LLVLIFVIGVYPNMFIEKMTPSIKKVIAHTRIEPITTAKIAVPVAETAEHAPTAQSVPAPSAEHTPAAEKPAGH